MAHSGVIAGALFDTSIRQRRRSIRPNYACFMTVPDVQFKDALVAALPAIRRFAFKLCGHGGQADDLVQATCERALQRWHQFEAGTRMESWLFAIMHSIWKNQLRHDAKRRLVVQEIAAEQTSRDGERETVGKIYLNQVLSALETLPEHQAISMFLVYLEGCSYREAAEILDIPQGTLESRLARARVALGRKLDEAKTPTPSGDDGSTSGQSE